MADDYLLSPVKTEKKLLEEAIDLQIEYIQVLPELGIITHIYTIFVYEEILLKKRDNPLSVLEALRLASESDSLDLLGKLKVLPNIKEEERKEILDCLRSRGIKYLDQYLAYE
jgi:hypothetical protein